MQSCFVYIALKFGCQRVIRILLVKYQTVTSEDQMDYLPE
jgi:hypothetical protein